MNISGIKAKHVLIFCVLSYVFAASNAYLNPYYPGGVDAASHLFRTWFIKENGLASWNPFWYSGSPLLDQYPPLTHICAALLSDILGVVNGYKVAYAAGFVMLPICFYLLLKEFSVSEKEKSIAMLLFSFSVIYVHYFQEGVFAALISFNYAILYFKYLKKTIDACSLKNTLISALFLSLTALSHALNPVYAVVFSIPMILVYSAKRLKEFAVILFLTALLTSWFWMPYFANYPSPQSPPAGFNIFTIPTEFGRAFVVSANYLGIAFVLLFATAILYVTYKNIRQKKEIKYTFYLASISAVMMLLRFVPILGLQETKRALFFAPMFLSIYVAKGLSGARKWKTVSFLLVAPLIILFFAYTPVTVDVNQDVTGIMSLVKDSPGDRVLFLPERFDLITSNESDFPVAEDTYSSFLVPYLTGKEVVNGLWSVGALTVNKPQEYFRIVNMKCQDTKTYSELINDASWINKNTLGERKLCEPQLNASVYCETAKKASLDTIVVNKFFPEVVSYIGSMPCLVKSGENDGFVLYWVENKTPYVYFDDPGVKYNYSQDLGTIQINLASNDAIKTKVHVAESFVDHWNLYVDGIKQPIARDSFGFMEAGLDLTGGSHSLVLKYEPKNFGNIFAYVSIVSWIILIASLILLRETRVR